MLRCAWPAASAPGLVSHRPAPAHHRPAKVRHSRLAASERDPHALRMSVRCSILATMFLWSLLLASACGAQTFTRITDPANPIVTDALLSTGGSWVDLVGDGYLDLF